MSRYWSSGSDKPAFRVVEEGVRFDNYAGRLVAHRNVYGPWSRRNGATAQRNQLRGDWEHWLKAHPVNQLFTLEIQESTAWREVVV